MEVDFAKLGESGVLSIGITKELGAKVKELQARNKTDLLPIFSYTTCAKNIALFEDHFKIALEKVSDEPCVVGVRIEGEVRWYYEKSSLRLITTALSSEDYIEKDATKMYELPSGMTKYTVSVLV